MPSPFTPFKEQQVQPINILPYTAGIAQSIQQGISDLGKGIGEAIQKYQEEKQNNSVMAGTLAYDINQNLVPEMEDVPDTGVTGNGEAGKRPTGKMLIKDNAPSHLVKLYKQAEKLGDGDWVRGLANVGGDEIKSAYATNQYHKNEIERKLKNRDTETTIALHEAQLLNEDLKLQNAKLELANKQALVEINSTDVPTSVTVTKRTEEKIPRTGIINVNGEEKLSFDVDEDLIALGYKPEDVRKKSNDPIDVDKITKQAIAKNVSGDAEFDVTNSDSVTNPSQKKLDFIRNVHKALVESDPSNKAKYDKFFLWNGKTFNKEPQLQKAGAKGVQDTFKLAVDSFNQSPTLFSYFQGKTKITKENALQKFNAKGVRIVQEDPDWGSEYVYLSQKVDINEYQQTVNRYNTAKKKIEARGGSIPFSLTDYINNSGVLGTTLSSAILPDGTRIVTDKSGTPIFGGGSSLSGKKERLNEVESQREYLRNYLAPFVPQKLKDGSETYGKEIGNYTVQFQVKPEHMATGEYEKSNVRIKPEKMQEELDDSTELMLGVEQGINQLKEIRKEMSKWGEMNMPSDLKIKYEAVVKKIASLSRKFLIGTGTETEQDWDRIAEQLVSPSFWRGMQTSDETANEVLDSLTNLVTSKAVLRWNNSNFKVFDKDGAEVKPFSNKNAPTTLKELEAKILAVQNKKK